MQPYVDPTRKTTSKKMEDNLKKNEMKDDLTKKEDDLKKEKEKKGRRPKT